MPFLCIFWEVKLKKIFKISFLSFLINLTNCILYEAMWDQFLSRVGKRQLLFCHPLLVSFILPSFLLLFSSSSSSSYPFPPHKLKEDKREEMKEAELKQKCEKAHIVRWICDRKLILLNCRMVGEIYWTPKKNTHTYHHQHVNIQLHMHSVARKCSRNQAHLTKGRQICLLILAFFFFSSVSSRASSRRHIPFWSVSKTSSSSPVLNYSLLLPPIFYHPLLILQHQDHHSLFPLPSFCPFLHSLLIVFLPSHWAICCRHAFSVLQPI